MPGPGQKSVTLPAELVDEVRVRVEGRSTVTEFIREATREKLDRATSTTDVDHQQSAKDLETDSGRDTRPTDVETAPRLSNRPVETTVGEKDPVADAPSEPIPTTRGSTSSGGSVATSSPKLPTPTSRRRTPRLERPSTAASAGPVVVVEGSSPASMHSASPSSLRSARDVPEGGREGLATATPAPEISTFTCRRCRVTLPLEQRWDHVASCRADPLATRVEGKAGEAQPGIPGARDRPKQGPGSQQDIPAGPKSDARRVDLERLVRYVKMFVTSAKDSSDRRAYLAVAVQAGHRDQNVAEPSDAEALELVDALAAREPAIERVLEFVRDDLAPPSKSTRSPKTKGGDDGRR